MPAERHDFSEWADVARTIAATLVVISHARGLLMIDYPGQVPWLPFYALTGFGHSAVIVFFVLSGYWISRSVLARIDGPWFWRNYLINRLSRLGIVLVPALLLGGVLDFIGLRIGCLPIYQGLPGAHGLIQNVAANLTWYNFIGNLAFLQTIWLPPYGSNTPLWSLAYEFWYYIWFPVLVLVVRRRQFSWFLPALLIGIEQPALYLGFVCWLVGWVVLCSVGSASAKPVGRGWAWAAAGLFAIVLLGTGISRQTWTQVPLAASFGLLLLAAARTALPLPRWLKPLAVYGRRASFSLYAIHFPVMLLLAGCVIGQVRLAPNGRSLLLVLALTAICLVVGGLFAHCSEAFTDRLRHWLRQRLMPNAQPERV